MLLTKRIYILLFVIQSLNCYAQYKDARFEHMTVENGLPFNQTQCIMQDRLGYMWIGADRALVRYDGYQIKTYHLADNNSALLSFVNNIFEDSKGTLWVVTSDGLFRYDRSNDSFIPIKNSAKYNNTSGSTVLLKVFEDRWQNLWEEYWDAKYKVNFYNRYSPSTGSFKTFSIKDKGAGHINASNLNSLCQAANGMLWLGTSNGLYQYNAESSRFQPGYFSSADSMKREDIGLVYEAPSEPGVLWLTFNGKKRAGIIRFNTHNNSFKRYEHNSTSQSLGNDTVNQIFEDEEHRLWFGSQKGISLFDRKTGQFRNFLPKDAGKEADQDAISAIQERPDGNFWLISGHGLLFFDPQTGDFDRLAADPKNPDALGDDNYLPQILVDRTGLLWVATGRGVDRLNDLRSQFMRYRYDPSQKNGYPGGSVSGFVQSADGLCWLGSDEGPLINWDPATDRFKKLTLPKISNKGVDVQLIDHDGLLWCSTVKGQLFTYDPRTGAVDTFKNKKYWPVNLLKSTDQPVVFQDHTGIIWIGKDQIGLYSLDKKNGRFTSYPYEEERYDNTVKSNKLNGPDIRCIFEDREGTIWVGTENGGLNRFDRKTGTFESNYNLDDKLKWVRQMYEDKAGRFWVATIFDGLFLFDPQTRKSRQFTEKDGLPGGAVLGILEDDACNIWLRCDGGISRLYPRNFAFTNYTAANSVSLGGDGLSRKMAGGRFLLTVPGGFVTFFPGQVTKNLFPPQVNIDALTISDPRSVNRKSTSLIAFGKQQIELQHNQNQVRFSYVALHYQNPGQNQYAYRLDGYDNHWVQGGTQRSVTYTNLSPGTYTFHLKAANSDGIWNEKGASFIIIIYPPWWFTWWAWLFYIILFVVAVYAIVAYRSRKLKQDNRILEQKVQARTEEVIHQKEEIQAQRDNLETQRNHLEDTLGKLKTTQNQLIQREKMVSLGELTAGIAHEIQNPLNFVNNFSEVNEEMIGEMEDELNSGRIDEALAIAGDIKENEKKIRQHGKRAESIVKGMLEHSRTGNGEKQATNINALCDEYLRLAYHGMRTKDKDFSAELLTNFAEGLPQIEVVQQDMSRVLLNIFNNAFYAVNQKLKTAGVDYKPEVAVTTLSEKGNIIIKIRDNGNGIPDAIKDKIMQPFFTTKPTGEGTGLGLSLTYDIVVKAHNGSIDFLTGVGNYTEFTVKLPLS